jgi:hypothetical protein
MSGCVPQNVKIEIDWMQRMWPPTWSQMQRYRWFWIGPLYITWEWERKGARYGLTEPVSAASDAERVLDEVYAKVLRVRARLGLIEAVYKEPRVVSEIRLLDEAIALVQGRIVDA